MHETFPAFLTAWWLSEWHIYDYAIFLINATMNTDIWILYTHTHIAHQYISDENDWSEVALSAYFYIYIYSQLSVHNQQTSFIQWLLIEMECLQFSFIFLSLSLSWYSVTLSDCPKPFGCTLWQRVSLSLDLVRTANSILNNIITISFRFISANKQNKFRKNGK